MQRNTQLLKVPLVHSLDVGLCTLLTTDLFPLLKSPSLVYSPEEKLKSVPHFSLLPPSKLINLSKAPSSSSISKMSAEGEDVVVGEEKKEEAEETAVTEINPHDIEKQEEDKLKIKYPAAAKPMAGHSAFLQKRLAKGQKYFDSGDYQMAKQTGKGKVNRPMPPILSVAPEIPTAENVTTRKTSVVQPSKLAST
ncbi:alpha-endosulfine [Folsomia candida]|uniref:Alpha-endosulfine n=1 Tax=Folsomia candida TaxID=158441 RepID=A0A226F427_FOLCA|nr:alpha-endosulfine [Folsomia candida]OXA63941.1 Alpha-endosulfine [Folsomia candida]